MDEPMRERFVNARIGRLATVTPQGAAHVVPTVFAEADGVVYTCVDHKPKRTYRLQRLANIVANPAVSLLVDHYSDEWSRLWWVRVDGRAEVITPESPVGAFAIDLLAEKYPQYRDQRPDGPVIVIRELTWHQWSAS
ncbi:TIGR03668 family PPOX class F420-dependent oxidoreductase [Gordonia jinhuaensis]|uniref:PPOX class F420-dependent oxidoreductase n=2 Tax=Gordonia jinhuaensis TaxID=1517702 RepID=A0A916TDX8_9ACTN|nr:PPOX class F420-dependent oxidoreductase [Gordonia jinhuaensis]